MLSHIIIQYLKVIFVDVAIDLMKNELLLGGCQTCSGVTAFAKF